MPHSRPCLIRGLFFRGLIFRGRGLLILLTIAPLVFSAEPPAHDPTPEPTHDPARAIAALDVHPDLEATLFAAEPTVLSLSAMDVDHLGRIWVCEVVNYRHFANPDNPVREAGDRILILEDTDHDGRADRTTVFYQGRDVDSAHGVCILGERVLISAQGRVLELFDRDGDGRADEKKVLFTGVSGEDHDHGIHAFQFGPDGKLYFNFGNEGKRILDAAGEPVIDRAGHIVAAHRRPYQEGMVFRCDLDGGGFETLGWNFRNNWEVAVDAFGALWQSDNDDDGNRAVRINYVMEYGNYGYRDELTGAGWRTPRTGMADAVPRRHWHLNDPGVVPTLLLTGAGAPTGIIIYEGDLLPLVFRNQIIHCDAGPNVVRSYTVAPDGAGYRVTETVNILKGARDPWFRPSDVVAAPDGSLFIADWYDPGVGGHRMADIERGRVFRIAPPGHRRYETPAFDFTTPEGAAEALKNPNNAVRYLGWTALHEMGRNAEPALLRLWQSDNPRHRARALWLLGKIEGRGRHYVDLAAGDDHPDIRITAIRLARQLDGVDTLSVAQRLVRDPSPRVRRECAIALRFDGAAPAHKLWAELAARHDGRDRWYLEALGIGADLHWPARFAVWREKVGGEGATPASAEAGPRPELPGLPGLPGAGPAARDIIWRSRAPEAAPMLARIILDPATAPAERPRYFRAFDFHPPEVSDPVLMSLLEAAEAGTSGGGRSGGGGGGEGAEAAQADPPADHPGAPGIAALALQHLSTTDVEGSPVLRRAIERALAETRGTPQYVDLVRRFDLRGHHDELLRLALASAEGATEGPRSGTNDLAVSAALQLVRFGEQERLRAVLGGDDQQNALALLHALALSGDNAALKLIGEVMTDTARPLPLRAAAAAALGRTRSGEWWLLGTVKGGHLPADLKPAAAEVLLASGDPNIRTDAAELLPPPATTRHPRATSRDRGGAGLRAATVADLAQRRGDAHRGRAVFQRLCLTCHRVAGAGVEYGPDLSEIGDKLAREELFTSILDPSAAITFGYEGWLIELAGGGQLLGYITSETDQHLTLRMQGGVSRRIAKSEINSRTQQDLSLMLPNLHQSMTEQELVDLVEYLAGLRKAE